MTIAMLHRLRSKGFDKLYSQQKAKWKELAANAAGFIKANVKGTESIRPGDVAQALELSLEIDPAFESFVVSKRLPQKYWVSLFAEYIVDQIYPPAPVK